VRFGFGSSCHVAVPSSPEAEELVGRKDLQGESMAVAPVGLAQMLQQEAKGVTVGQQAKQVWKVCDPQTAFQLPGAPEQDVGFP